jgi:hypothetical protein
LLGTNLPSRREGASPNGRDKLASYKLGAPPRRSPSPFVKALGLTPALRKRAAIHEAGHAVVAIRLGLACEVPISLRGDAMLMGALPTPFGHDDTRKAIEGMISVALAGRAAEEVIFGNVSASAGGSEDSDLARATMLAIGMITNFKLSAHERLLWRGDASARMLQAFPALGEEVERMYLVATFGPAVCSANMLLICVRLPIWRSIGLACPTRRLGPLSKNHARAEMLSSNEHHS